MKRITILKNIVLILLIVFVSTLLVSCGEEEMPKSFYDAEYVLVDDNGTIKCKNFDYVVCLEKKKDEDFKVLNFGDIQLDDLDVEDQVDYVLESLNMIRELIEETKPDLITLTGDQCYGYDNVIIALADVIDSYGIPWAPVFGNHDQECNNISLSDQVALYASYEHCLAKLGPIELYETNSGMPKIMNYIINIVERNGKGFNVVRSIFMFNTGMYFRTSSSLENRLNDSDYEHLSKRQLDFYEWGVKSSKKYNNGEYAKSTIIEHIPITAYAFALADAFNSDYTAYQMPKILDEFKNVSLEDTYNGSCWNDGYKDSFGMCREIVHCSPFDDGIFDLLKQYGSTDSVLCGHDHNNNLCINYQGIKLAYTLKTGKGCYYNPELQGGTVLVFSNNDVSIEHIYKTESK